MSSPRDPPPPPTERTVRHSVSWQVDVLIMVKSNCLFNHGTLPCFLEVFSLGKVSHPSWVVAAVGCSPASSSVRQSVWRQRSPPRASELLFPVRPRRHRHRHRLSVCRRRVGRGISVPWRNANSANSLRKFHDGVRFRKDKLSLH